MKDFFIIGGCWAISFLFNGIEAGLTSIDPVRLRHHVKLNRPAAVRLDRLLKTPERLLVTVLLITNLADILALFVMTRFLVSRFAATGFFLAVFIALPVYLFVLSVLPAQKKRARLFAAREELKQITTQSEREGSLTATERAMIHNVVDFQNVTARDVMKPLSKVASLKPESAIEDVFNMSRSTGFDRLPVIGAIGDAVGLVNVLDILLDKNPPRSLN